MVEELKTLKDLEQEYEDELSYSGETEPLIYYKCSNCGKECNEFERDTIDFIHRGLRKEAIKWIKAIDRDNSSGELALRLGFVTSCGNINMYGARTILIHFFNITNEELR
jgi:hypothetical protein